MKAAEDSPSIFINRDQKISRRVQGDARDVAAMRVWEGTRGVTDDVNTNIIIYALIRVEIVKVIT